jgi:molybdate transport system substrate-binding protein
MSNSNILSGSAAQGLVTNLAPAFKAWTGFDIKGEFNAVGAVADKLRSGVPADQGGARGLVAGALKRSQRAAAAAAR